VLRLLLLVLLVCGDGARQPCRSSGVWTSVRPLPLHRAAAASLEPHCACL